MVATKKRIRKVAQNGVVIGGMVVNDLTTESDKNAPSVNAVNAAIQSTLDGIEDKLDKILNG